MDTRTDRVKTECLQQLNQSSESI